MWNSRGSPRQWCMYHYMCTHIHTYIHTYTHTYIHRVPNRNPLQTQGLPTSKITTREAPHKQNYDQGGSPQAKLPPGGLTTSRITPRHWAMSSPIKSDCPVSRHCAVSFPINSCWPASRHWAMSSPINSYCPVSCHWAMSSPIKRHRWMSRHWAMSSR